MAGLIVGLFAPIGLTVFTLGMDVVQRRMETPGRGKSRALPVIRGAVVPAASLTDAAPRARKLN